MEIGRATAVLPFESVDAFEAGFAERVNAHALFLSSGMVEGAVAFDVGARVDIDIAIAGGIVALRVVGVVAWHYGEDGGVPAGREHGFGVVIVDVVDGRALFDRLLQRHGSGTRVRVPGARIVQRLHLGPSGFVSSRGEGAIATGITLPPLVAATDDDLDATLAPPSRSTALTSSSAGHFLDQETALADLDDATVVPAPEAPDGGRLAVLAAALASQGSSEGVDGPTLDGDNNAPLPKLLSLPDDALTPLAATVVAGPIEGAASLLGLEPPSDSDSGEEHSAFSAGPTTSTPPRLSSSSDEALFKDPPDTGLADTDGPTESGGQSDHGPAMLALLAEALADDDDDDEHVNVDGADSAVDGADSADDVDDEVDEASVTAPRPSERSLRMSTDAGPPPGMAAADGEHDDDEGEATIDRVTAPSGDGGVGDLGDGVGGLDGIDHLNVVGGANVALDDGVLGAAVMALDDDIGLAVDAFSDEVVARPPPVATSAGMDLTELASFPEAPPAEKPFEAQSTDVDLLASISAADVIALDDGPSEVEERGLEDALVSVDADLIDSELWPDASPFESNLTLEPIETELFSTRHLPPPTPWPEWSDLIDARTMGVSFSFTKRGQAHLEFFSWPVSGTKRYSGTGQGESSDPRRQRTSVVPMADGLDSDAPGPDDDEDVFSGPATVAPAPPPALSSAAWAASTSGPDPFEQQGTDPRMNVEGLVARHVRASHREVSEDGDLFDDAIPELDRGRGGREAKNLDDDGEHDDDSRDETMDEMRLPALVIAGNVDGVDAPARPRTPLPPSWPVTSSGEGHADLASDEASEPSSEA